MTDKHFQAILAKNEIAKALRDYVDSDEELAVNHVFAMLQEIEEYIGQGNQPSALDIYNDRRRAHYPQYN